MKGEKEEHFIPVQKTLKPIGAKKLVFASRYKNFFAFCTCKKLMKMQTDVGRIGKSILFISSFSAGMKRTCERSPMNRVGAYRELCLTVFETASGSLLNNISTETEYEFRVKSLKISNFRGFQNRKPGGNERKIQ